VQAVEDNLNGNPGNMILVTKLAQVGKEAAKALSGQYGGNWNNPLE
jgi:hypothetical protein